MKKAALLGYGVVGGGVAEILTRNAELIEKKCGERIELAYILDKRDNSKDRLAHLMVQDFSVIEKDPEVSVVAEAIGGTGVALQFCKRALARGISVVTSNKQLVAEYGAELLSLAEENGCQFLFEAAVGGGIPVLHPIYSCFSCNEIIEICGILNGTTNYILTEMLDHAAAYSAALSRAQQLGYAEQDPTADVEGLDAGRKTCILADMAYGKTVSPDEISVCGISSVTEADAAFAERAGMKIKLLGRTVHRDEKYYAFVRPHFVPLSHPLASVSGVNNAVLVRGSQVGDVMFYGPGAGRYPTASAVVNDIIELAKNPSRPQPVFWEANALRLSDAKDFSCRYFFTTKQSREACEEKLGKITWIPMADDLQGGITEPITEKALLASGLSIQTVYPVLDA